MTIVILPPRCNRAFAEEILPELMSAVEAGAVEIDGSQVEQVGQAVLQLLLSARSTGDCAIARPSPALVQTARLTGLSATLFGEIQP